MLLVEIDASNEPLDWMPTIYSLARQASDLCPILFNICSHFDQRFVDMIVRGLQMKVWSDVHVLLNATEHELLEHMNDVMLVYVPFRPAIIHPLMVEQAYFLHDRSPFGDLTFPTAKVRGLARDVLHGGDYPSIETVVNVIGSELHYDVRPERSKRGYLCSLQKGRLITPFYMDGMDHEFLDPDAAPIMANDVIDDVGINRIIGRGSKHISICSTYAVEIEWDN